MEGSIALHKLYCKPLVFQNSFLSTAIMCMSNISCLYLNIQYWGCEDRRKEMKNIALKMCYMRPSKRVNHRKIISGTDIVV